MSTPRWLFHGTEPSDHALKCSKCGYILPLPDDEISDAQDDYGETFCPGCHSEMLYFLNLGGYRWENLSDFEKEFLLQETTIRNEENLKNGEECIVDLYEYPFAVRATYRKGNIKIDDDAKVFDGVGFDCFEYQRTTTFDSGMPKYENEFTIELDLDNELMPF